MFETPVFLEDVMAATNDNCTASCGLIGLSLCQLQMFSVVDA